MSHTDRLSRLTAIPYRFSTQTTAQHEGIVALIDLLARDSMSNHENDPCRVTLQPNTSHHAEPITVLEAVGGPSHLALQSDTKGEQIIEGIPFLNAEEYESNQYPEQWREGLENGECLVTEGERLAP